MFKTLDINAVYEVMFEGEVHLMDKDTGQMYKIEENEIEPIDESILLDLLDSLSEESFNKLFGEEVLDEVVLDKRDFVVHYTPHGSDKKTRRKETAFSPAGLARKYEMNDHKVHDITHNGKSVMDEVRHVNSSRMNEDLSEDELNELSTDLLNRYRTAATAHAKQIFTKAKEAGNHLQSHTAKYAEKDSPEQEKYNKRKRNVDKVGSKIAIRLDNERKAANKSKPMSTGDYIQKQYGQGRYMGDSVDMSDVAAICEELRLEGGVYFHPNPVIKNKGHLLAIQNILSSAGAAGRKSFSGTQLAKVTKKIHDTAGIGNDVWDHIHTSRDDKNESAVTFVKSFSEFVLESIGEEPKSISEYEVPCDLTIEDFSVGELQAFVESEEFEQLDELSKETLRNYISKAAVDATATGMEYGKDQDFDKFKRSSDRLRGLHKAVNKLARKAD